MQTWKNITVNLPGYNLKKALELLSGIDTLSLSIVEKPGVENFEWFEETKKDIILNGSENNLVILVEATRDTSDILKEIRYHLKLDYCPKYAVEIFEDKDWVAESKSIFKQIIVSKNLRIVPPWDSESSFEGKTIIINPGAGFGIGSHPTTQLCACWIEDNLRLGNSLLDFGCGSGILSIVGSFCGAENIVAVDKDKNALENAKYNLKLNNVRADLFNSEEFQIKSKYDIVIANILSNVLVEIEPLLRSLVGNRLVLSGILPNQAMLIREIYSSWLSFDQILKKDGWLLISGRI